MSIGAPRRPSPALRAICAVLHALPRLHRCAGYCLGRAVHVVSVGQSFSSLATGVCVVVNTTAEAFVDKGNIELTAHDDCLVVAGENSAGSWPGWAAGFGG